jgi:type VI secretion system secreted protein VgrG
MSDNLSQANRTGKLTTPLGEDKLVLSQFRAAEGLSQCFTFTIEAFSSSKDINFNDVLGKHCSIAIKTPNDQRRYFDGILIEATFLEAVHLINGQTIYAYSLVLRPWFWLLSHRADCRIYHNKDVKEIIQDVFQRAGFSGDVDLKLQESYPKLEYCVQYCETDFAFVSRLMEEFGIYYFFEHSDRKHKMVLVDNKSAHTSVPTLDGGKIPYRDRLQESDNKQELLSSWTSGRQFRTGKFALNDYDYLKPNADLKGEAEGHENYEKSKFEIYDYPGKYVDRSVGEKLARVRLEAEQCADHRRHAAGEAVSLFPGGKITLSDNNAEPKTDFLVVNARHSYRQQSYRSGESEEIEAYDGSYELLPSDQQFRAPQLTPHPRIYGIQTARVVGKAKEGEQEQEEIEVDEHGRILVHFFWDRHGEKSCPVRIGQPWAQKQWGHIVIPRIGQEVVVEFLEGDPDRPLVTGTVYNGDNKVPYKLPDKKTQSGIKTNSSKNGQGGYNEFRFEDQKDKEQVYLRAQKDLDSLIRNKETREIGTVFDTDEGKSSRATTLKHGDDELALETGSRKIKIAVDRKEDIGNNEIVKIGGDQEINVGKNITIKAGMQIVLAVGGNTITIDPSGITVVGNLVKIN